MMICSHVHHPQMHRNCKYVFLILLKQVPDVTVQIIESVGHSITQGFKIQVLKYAITWE